MIPREDEDFSTKQETASSWSRFKDPRVVRVSKAFGGKDRHSKVCTIRGLRDRRVRLSVPTAIQLYDLQERLGLNQPSKVVDWLLNAAKHEIDDLPPLQIPQATFNPILPSQSDKQGLKINRDRNDELNIGNQGDYVSSSSQNPTSFTSLLSSTTSPYNSFASNLTLSHPQISLGLTGQHEDLHNYSLVQLQPSAGSHQVLVYQPGLIKTHPYFPSQIAPTNTAFDLKQPNFHTSNSSSDQIIRPFQFTADLLSSQNKQQDELHSS